MQEAFEVGIPRGRRRCRPDPKKVLADRLSLYEQQIQRYEANNDASASLTRVCEVARSLGLKVKAEASVA